MVTSLTTILTLVPRSGTSITLNIKIIKLSFLTLEIKQQNGTHIVKWNDE